MATETSSPDAAGPRHVIISGGSRGLGQTLVQGLLDAGYCVSSCSRSSTEFTERLGQENRFLFREADVSNLDHLDEFVSAASKRFGSPFGLINCAGIAMDGVLATMPDQQIDQLLAVNLGGTLHLTRRTVRQMLLGKLGGSIINISSIIGLRGYSGLSAYAATKGGMDAVTRSLAPRAGQTSASASIRSHPAISKPR